MKLENKTKKELIEMLEAKTSVEVSNNVVTTEIKWEAESIKAVNDIAAALKNMTEVFANQNIQMSAIEINQNISKDEL